MIFSLLFDKGEDRITFIVCCEVGYLNPSIMMFGHDNHVYR
jgi:hypothetical protein